MIYIITQDFDSGSEHHEEGDKLDVKEENEVAFKIKYSTAIDMGLIIAQEPKAVDTKEPLAKVIKKDKDVVPKKPTSFFGKQKKSPVAKEEVPTATKEEVAPVAKEEVPTATKEEVAPVAKEVEKPAVNPAPRKK